jgi:hypothetical protein
MSKILSLFLLLTFFAADNPKLVRVKFSKSISASVPSDFTLMTDDELADKYPSTRKPVAMFISPDKQVDFGMNNASQKFPGSDLHVLKDFYKANLYTLFNNVKILNEGVRKVNGQDFIYFEFTSEVKPDEKAVTPQSPIKKYSFIQYTLFNDYLMVFNFSCPQSLQSQWQGTAGKIMSSIKISKNSKPEPSKK